MGENEKGLLMMDNQRRLLDRRRFIACGAAAAAMPTLLSGRSASADGAPWQMRLSTSSIHFKGLPIEQACERISALGFEAIDIWSPHQKCPHLDDCLDRLGPDGLKNVLARNNLKLYSFSVYAGGYLKYAELLGKVGGGVAIHGSAKACKPDELTAQMRQLMERLKPEMELCEKYNSYVAIENHGNALLDSLDSFKAFVDLNTSPRLGVALAPFHLQRINASVPEAIRICGKQLFFFYAWQLGKGVEQLPDHGPTDFTPWIKSLAEIGYPWYVNPFMHQEPPPDEMSAALAKSRDYLKECYAKAVAR
ncbi:MAG: TIM barrel protein [Planctomycetota bacterium]